MKSDNELVVMPKSWVEAPGRTFVGMTFDDQEPSKTMGYFKTAAGSHFGFLEPDGTAKINPVFHSNEYFLP